MPDETNNLTVSDLATALGLTTSATKAEVLAAISSLRGGGRSPRRLSKKFTSKQHFEQLSKQEVRVRVVAPHPIAERGGHYCPAVLSPNGQVKTPGDVFITDRARLLKLGPMVEEVDKGTPTTAELAAKKAA